MNSFKIYFLLFCVGTLLISCSNSYVDNIERQSGFNYVDAHPELRLATNGYTSENFSEIEITGEIVHSSLTYSSLHGVYRSSFDIEINIFNSENALVVTESLIDSVISESDGIINSQDLYVFERKFQLKPGKYRVLVSVTDKMSDKTTTRQREVVLIDPKETPFEIANVSLLTIQKEGDEYSFGNHTTYDIPGIVDSLKFQFQIINNIPDTEFDIRMNLLKFESDQSPARALYRPNYNSSSIEYKGIDHSEYDEIESSFRTISQQGVIQIEYNFSELEAGNYRLEVSSVIDNEENYRAIEFGIKSENYPTIKNAFELAEPLVYLMSDKEYEQLMSITSQDELKKAVDSFWLSNIGNSVIARDVISQYYQRVEEANKQFSNFKAGWKTDPGMIYILFGPPWYVNSTLNILSWSYTYNSNNPDKNFIFRTPQMKSKYFPFENYLLERDRNYYNLQYQQIQKWLNGYILYDRM